MGRDLVYLHDGVYGFAGGSAHGNGNQALIEGRTAYGGGGGKVMPLVISKYAIFTRATIPIPRNWTHYEDGLPWVVWLRENVDGDWSTKLLGTAATWQAACLLASTHYQYGWPLGYRMRRAVDVFDARTPGVWRYNVQREIG